MKRVAVALCFFLLCSSVHADITSDLVAHWKFDEGTGTIDPTVLELGNTETIDVFNNPREFAAYGTTNPAFVNFLKSVKTPARYSSTGRDKTLFAKFVEAVRKMLGIPPKDFNALVDLLDITDRLAGTKITPYRTGAAKIGASVKQHHQKPAVLAPLFLAALDTL